MGIGMITRGRYALGGKRTWKILNLRAALNASIYGPVEAARRYGGELPQGRATTATFARLRAAVGPAGAKHLRRGV